MNTAPIYAPDQLVGPSFPTAAGLEVVEVEEIEVAALDAYPAADGLDAIEIETVEIQGNSVSLARANGCDQPDSARRTCSGTPAVRDLVSRVAAGARKGAGISTGATALQQTGGAVV